MEITGTVEFMGRPACTLVGPMGGQGSGFLCGPSQPGPEQVSGISDRLRGANDESGLTSVGIYTSALGIIVLADRGHHRAYWDTAGQVSYPVNTPG